MKILLYILAIIGCCTVCSILFLWVVYFGSWLYKVRRKNK